MLRFKEYYILRELSVLNELSVNPLYRTKAGSFPYYLLDKTVVTTVKKKLGNPRDAIKFKCIATKSKQKADFNKLVKGDNVIVVSRGGGFLFQVHTSKNKPFKYEKKVWYVQTNKKQVTAHDGIATRKDATASANINEFLTMYFLKNPVKSIGDLSAWENDVGSKTRNTGIYYGDEGKGEVSYDALRILLLKDATAARDIKIGWNNAKAVKSDLGTETIKKYFWTPSKKPGNVNQKNPSDVMVELEHKGTGRRFRGYSNKATSGKDVTPKFNTNVDAFYEQFGESDQVTAVEDMMDEALTYVTSTLWTDERKKKYPKSWKAIQDNDPMSDEYSESGSKSHFQNIGSAFEDEKLDFYGKDFYHPYRNWFIGLFVDYLGDAENLAYFLRTVSFYTWGIESDTDDDCPYKLLVGSESSSTITEVSADENKKSALSGKITPASNQYKNISTTYDNKSQSFKLNFDVEDNGITSKVEIPITVRTRAEGGFSGKSLFITTPGVKIT